MNILNLTGTALLLCFLPLSVPAQEKPIEPKPPTQTGKTETPLRAGKDRWKVKTAADSDVRSVKAAAVKMTVEKMLALPRPPDFPTDRISEKYQERRAAPVETTVYAVEADIVEYRLMPDGDVRVVLRGASGKTMVLEMPDPDPKFVDPSSPFAYAIRTARERFESRLKPERTAKTTREHARITGIGFFGRNYGKTKADGNLVQLHPAIDFEWLDKPTPEFAAAQRELEKTEKKTPAPTP